MAPGLNFEMLKTEQNQFAWKIYIFWNMKASYKRHKLNNMYLCMYDYIFPRTSHRVSGSVRSNTEAFSTPQPWSSFGHMQRSWEMANTLGMSRRVISRSTCIRRRSLGALAGCPMVTHQIHGPDLARRLDLMADSTSCPEFVGFRTRLVDLR